METWKDIVGYEGMYQISSIGRVKSLARKIIYKNGRIKNQKERILKPGKVNGYLHIELSKDGSWVHKYIHRLVAEAFFNNYSDDLEINHIDFDKTNNRVDNLECVTRLENMKHAFKHNKVTLPPPQKPKKIICITDNKTFDSIKDASTYYHINSSLICNQLKGKHKSTHGKTFKYGIELEEV